MFEASTTVQVGDGRNTLFWQAKWLEGDSIRSFAPELYKVVDKRACKSRIMNEALIGNRWIRDISGSLSVLALQ
jgi:hypothetical protein